MLNSILFCDTKPVQKSDNGRHLLIFVGSGQYSSCCILYSLGHMYALNSRGPQTVSGKTGPCGTSKVHMV